MQKWNKVVSFCKSHYEDCYKCPLRGACWEERRDKRKPRTADEYQRDMVYAYDLLLQSEVSE